MVKSWALTKAPAASCAGSVQHGVKLELDRAIVEVTQTNQSNCNAEVELDAREVQVSGHTGHLGIACNRACTCHKGNGASEDDEMSDALMFPRSLETNAVRQYIEEHSGLTPITYR